MSRLKLIVAYDGSPFSGWQSQPNRNGIQDHLEHAFKQIAGESVRVHGAGRTDAGVHALAQCAHVDLTKKRLTPPQWMRAINVLLPPAIRIMRCDYVNSNFHARFSATGKIYRYRLWAGPVLPPLEYGRAWHIATRFDVDLITSAAAPFIGRHDFAAFAANRGKRESSTTRTLKSIRVRHSGELVTVDLEADGFLYKMARLIVGSLMRHGCGKITVDEIARQLRGVKNPSTRFVAPACGLFLVRVRY